MTDTKGRILEVPLRKGKSDSAMIDYLTFTFGIETVYSWFPNEIIGDNQIGETLFQNKAERVETAKRMVNINFDKLERHARQQVGRMMNFMLDLGIKPDQICERLKAEDGKYPKGLNPEEYSYNGVTVKYMHQIGQGHQSDEYGILEDTSFNQPIDLKDIPNEL